MQRELVSLAQKPAGHQPHRGPQSLAKLCLLSHWSVRHGDIEGVLIHGALLSARQ